MPSILAAVHNGLHRHRSGLRRAAVAVAVLYALYLLAANVFLNTSLASLAFNRKPERFHIQWDSAFSLYPGHIHARRIKTGGHARTNVWAVTSSSADGRIKLLPLLGRRLSFGGIRARDVEVGVDRVPVDLPPSRPRTAAALARGPWRVHFDGIDTDSLRRIRIGDWVVEGGGQAHFGMNKVLRGGPVQVTPSWLRMPSARVRHDDTVLAEDARLDLALEMAPNTRVQARGYEKVRYIDARLQLAGRAPGLGVHEDDHGKLALATQGDTGRVEVDLSVRSGALQPGGRLHWDAPIVVDSSTSIAQGYRLLVDADVRAQGVAVHAQVPRRAGRDDAVDMRLLVGERRLLGVLPGDVLRKTSGDIKGRWHFATLRWLNPLLSEDWLRLDGEADIAADLHLRDGRLLPGSHAEILRAEVTADVFDTIASGQASAVGKVEAERVTVDFLAQRFALAPRAAKTEPYVTGRDLTLRLVGSRRLADFRRSMVAHAQFDDARIPDLRAYNRSLPAKSLRFEGGSGTVSADLVLDAKGVMRNGRVRLQGKRAAVIFGPSRVVGDVALETRLVRAGGDDAHRYRIEALKLGLDQLHVGEAKADTAPWWARLDFERGTLDWQQPVTLAGDARVVMKDVSALMDLYAERSAFPKWIGNLIDEGQATATAQVRLEGDTVILDRLRARNERVDLDARLRVAGGKSQGALYARWGVLGLGAEVRDGQRKLHLVKARQWYDGLPPLDSGATPP